MLITEEKKIFQHNKVEKWVKLKIFFFHISYHTLVWCIIWEIKEKMRRSRIFTHLTGRVHISFADNRTNDVVHSSTINWTYFRRDYRPTQGFFLGSNNVPFETGPRTAADSWDGQGARASLVSLSTLKIVLFSPSLTSLWICGRRTERGVNFTDHQTSCLQSWCNFFHMIQ